MATLFYNYSLECIFSVFSLFAVLYSCGDLTTYVLFKDSVDTVFVLLVLSLFFLFYKFAISKIGRFSVLSISIGIFAGVINVLGRNFVLHNNLDFFYKDKVFAIIFSVLAAIGYSFIYATIFEWGWKYLYTLKKAVLDDSKTGNTINYMVFEKNSFVYPVIIICFFWLPYFIIFYPGILSLDAIVALSQYYGLREWNFHHPVIGVLLMGYTMDIGRKLGNDNLGCTIYILLQYIIFSMTLAYSFVLYKKWQTPYVFRWVVLLFLSFFPVIPMFFVNEIKDTFYYVAVLWLLYLLIMALEGENKIFYILVAAMLTCCLRKEGFVICLSCIGLLVIFGNNLYGKWKKIIAPIATGICFWALITNLAGIHYNVKPGPIREALSLPVQCTARYIRDYRKEISRTEWKVLNVIFRDNAKNLGKLYNPNRSDPVKSKISYRLSKKQIMDYSKIWFACFLKQPGCYLSAMFNHFYGYFYIGKPEFYDRYEDRIGFYTRNVKEGDRWFTKSIHVTDWPIMENARKRMGAYFILWKKCIFINLSTRPATYTWLLVFAITSLIHYKKYKYLFLFIIPVVNLAVCCLSPLNGAIRYCYPTMLMSILLLAYIIKVVQEPEGSV